MPYNKQAWFNGPGGGTPLTAERLTHLEDGIERAHRLAADNFGGVRQIHVFGHSHAAGGYMSVAPDLMWAERFADSLGANVNLHAIGGARLVWPNSGGNGDGGFATVLQRLKRPYVTKRWFPLNELVILQYGENDLAQIGSQRIDIFKNLLRVALSRSCAVAIWEDEDPAWSYTGSWAATPLNFANSGSQISWGPEVGVTATFTLPSDYPGGLPVAIGMFVNNTNPSYKIGVTVDDGPQMEMTINTDFYCDKQTAAKHGALVLRFGTDGSLAPGVHTFKFELLDKLSGVGVQNSLAIDYAQVEADPQDGPVVMLAEPFRAQQYGMWSAFPYGPNHATDPMNDAAVMVLRQAVRDVAAEFGPRCIVVNLDDVYDRDARWFGPDQTHLGDDGNALQAEAFLSALAESELLTQRVRARGKSVWQPKWHLIGVYPAPPFLNGWSNFGSTLPLAGLRKERGRVFVRGAVKGGTVAPNTPMFVLPEGYRPRHETHFVLQSHNTSEWQVGTGLVKSNGEVVVLQNAHANITVFNFSFDLG